MQKKGMELEGLVKSGDVVLAGVSGGADSVCLLLMLLEYRKHCDFLLEAVHVEHGIRGEASRRDAAFVKGFAKSGRLLQDLSGGCPGVCQGTRPRR